MILAAHKTLGVGEEHSFHKFSEAKTVSDSNAEDSAPLSTLALDEKLPLARLLECESSDDDGRVDGALSFHF